MKSGELIDLDTKKKLLIDMLKEIVNFCENNNINYFLSEGTMLGALRHKGFIPWDDDIDIMMDLDNYNNFFNNFKSEKYKALNSENDKEYYYSFGKVVDTRGPYEHKLYEMFSQPNAVSADGKIVIDPNTISGPTMPDYFDDMDLGV